VIFSVPLSRTFAQGPSPASASARGQSASPTPKASAPFDVTGYWVSLVTEDWRYRMVTPTKGDYQGVPMNVAAKQVADQWDPKADEAAGEQCKSYGAPAFMRLAARFRFSWQDEKTLLVESDAGMQLRRLAFEELQAAATHSWQGHSVARWERPAGRGGPASSAAPPRGGWLKVVTTNLRAGYLRKNGVPYSENATLTEYFDLAPERTGPPILVVTAIVEDEKYLNQPFVVSSQFRKQADARGWDATSCSSTW
jgi:hypothetical protein